MSGKTYHWCVVPQCINTSRSTSQKLFIPVPYEVNSRRKWLQLAKRDPNELSTKSPLYLCEDHFDLPNDMANYMEYKIMGSVKSVRMKQGCFPSKFECHPDRINRTATSALRPAAIKRQRLAFVEEALESKRAVEAGSISLPPAYLEEKSSELEEPSAINKSSQVNIHRTHYRSKSSQCNINVRSVAISPFKIKSTTTTSTSPFALLSFGGKKSTKGTVRVRRKLMFVKEKISDSESSSYTPSVSHVDSSSSVESLHESKINSNSSINKQCLKIDEYKNAQLCLETTLRMIKKKPRFYIGIPNDWYFLVNIIHKHSNIPEEHVLLCLKKIRLKTTFSELGDNFGMSTSYASKLFMKNIPIIANYLRSFVRKLDNAAIKRNLPIAFRCKYNNVSCILDCLEIEIQKPSNSVHQALTWSEYKKGNTIKYLISCTPDGLINYISPGYGGRISDVLLVESCHFLDTLPAGASILADRGFKHIEELLLQRGLQLLRPPSVATDSKLSKKSVRQTKEIASLRIHIERVIRRVREFSMLKPHSVINSNLISILDDTIMIACALVNLQSSIIK